MKRLTRHLTTIIAVSIVTAGCVRDEVPPCPALDVVLSTKDWTYTNAASVGYNDPNAGTTDFKDVVPTVYCALRDASTGEIVRLIDMTEVSEAGPTYTIAFDDALPFGKYYISTWGAFDDGQRIADDSRSYNMNDYTGSLYVTSGSIDYQYNNHTIYADLQRVNGMVIVDTKWETFPEGINASEKTFTNLCTWVNDKFEFAKSQDITVKHTWEPTLTHSSTTLLPPSVREDGTKLHIRYYNSNKPDYQGLIPDDVTLTVRSNEITRLQYSFDPYTKKIIIHIMVNGQWQEINKMGVD